MRTQLQRSRSTVPAYYRCSTSTRLKCGFGTSVVPTQLCSGLALALWRRRIGWVLNLDIVPELHHIRIRMALLCGSNGLVSDMVLSWYSRGVVRTFAALYRYGVGVALVLKWRCIFIGGQPECSPNELRVGRSALRQPSAC